MYNLENEKHCPKCGGKMMDLVLTSYPAQCTSTCMGCGYTEDRDKNYVIDKVVGISCITTDGEKIFISFEN